MILPKDINGLIALLRIMRTSLLNDYHVDLGSEASINEFSEKVWNEVVSCVHDQPRYCIIPIGIKEVFYGPKIEVLRQELDDWMKKNAPTSKLETMIFDQGRMIKQDSATGPDYECMPPGIWSTC